MGNSRNNQEIDLLELFNALAKKWVWLLIATVLLSALFGLYALKMIAPTYQASVLMYVNNSSYSSAVDSLASKLDSTMLNSASKYVQTYLVILRSRLTMEEVIARANVSYSPDQLAQMISGSSVNETAIFQITVTSTSPDEACLIANTISEVLPEKIGNIINGASCRVVDYAIVPSARSAPNYSRYFAIGALIGFIAAAGVIVAMYLFNDGITSYDWLLSSFRDDVPLLSVVPNNSRKSQKRYGKYYRAYGESHTGASSDSKDRDGNA